MLISTGHDEQPVLQTVHYVNPDVLPIIECPDNRIDNSWLNSHIGTIVSKTEKRTASLGRKTLLHEFKDTIAQMCTCVSPDSRIARRILSLASTWVTSYPKSFLH